MSTNLYRALRELLPEPTLQVATVAAVYADGSVGVTYPGGATLRVRGEGVTAGDRVFIRAGAIEGAAPNLTYVEIDL